MCVSVTVTVTVSVTVSMSVCVCVCVSVSVSVSASAFPHGPKRASAILPTLRTPAQEHRSIDERETRD